MRTIKFVVVAELPQFPAGRVWETAKNGTPWGPESSGVEWDGWGVAMFGERKACVARVRAIRKAGGKARLERWVYEPGQQRARCFVERI